MSACYGRSPSLSELGATGKRTAALQDFLHTYNHHRRHPAVGGHPPISRASNAVGRYT